MPRKSPYEFTPDDWKILGMQYGLTPEEFATFSSRDKTSTRAAFKKHVSTPGLDDSSEDFFDTYQSLRQLIERIRCKIREQAE